MNDYNKIKCNNKIIEANVITAYIHNMVRRVIVIRHNRPGYIIWHVAADNVATTMYSGFAIKLKTLASY